MEYKKRARASKLSNNQPGVSDDLLNYSEKNVDLNASSFLKGIQHDYVEQLLSP